MKLGKPLANIIPVRSSSSVTCVRSITNTKQFQARGVLDSNSYNYFLLYFNVFYFWGFSPFRFKYNASIDSYCLEEPSRSRKVFCICMQILATLASLSFYRSVTPDIKFKENPNALFSIFNAFGYVAFFIPGLVFLVWRRTKNFQAFLHVCQQSKSNDKTRKGGRREKIAASFVVVLSLSLCLLLQYSEGYTLAPILENTILGNLKARAGVMEFNLYLRDSKTAVGPTEDISVGWIAFTIFYNFFSYYFSSLCFIFTSIPIFASLTIYSISKDFSKMLKPNSTMLQEQILEQYFIFKEVVRNLNGFTSVAVTLNFLTSLPYYPIEIIEILDGENSFSLMFILQTMACILIAAEANRKFGEIKNWALHMDVSLTKKFGTKLTMVYLDASMSPLGLQGGGLFTISYQFVGTGLSVLTTYIFISLQFSSSSSSSNKLI